MARAVDLIRLGHVHEPGRRVRRVPQPRLPALAPEEDLAGREQVRMHRQDVGRERGAPFPPGRGGARACRDEAGVHGSGLIQGELAAAGGAAGGGPAGEALPRGRGGAQRDAGAGRVRGGTARARRGARGDGAVDRRAESGLASDPSAAGAAPAAGDLQGERPLEEPRRHRAPLAHRRTAGDQAGAVAQPAHEGAPAAGARGERHDHPGRERRRAAGGRGLAVRDGAGDAGGARGHFAVAGAAAGDRQGLGRRGGRRDRLGFPGGVLAGVEQGEH